MALAVGGLTTAGMVRGGEGTPVSQAPGESVEFRSQAVAVTVLPSDEPTAAPVEYLGADGERITPERIRRFLDSKGSPMAPHAGTIVRAGIRFGVDPRVIVAIAGVETSYGLHAYAYNAWGWGSSRWSGWTAAIEGYSRNLAEGYRSLRTGRFAAASRSYCPPCGDKWGIKALSIFRQI
jgi:hypothetical protein